MTCAVWTLYICSSSPLFLTAPRWQVWAADGTGCGTDSSPAGSDPPYRYSDTTWPHHPGGRTLWGRVYRQGPGLERGSHRYTVWGDSSPVGSSRCTSRPCFSWYSPGQVCPNSPGTCSSTRSRCPWGGGMSPSMCDLYFEIMLVIENDWYCSLYTYFNRNHTHYLISWWNNDTKIVFPQARLTYYKYLNKWGISRWFANGTHYDYTWRPSSAAGG